VDFSKEGAHLAICKNPANGQEEVTVLKSKETNLTKMSEEVKITTSMTTFLETFFRMYHEDANELSKILGYEPIDWYYDYVGDDTEIEILKTVLDENVDIVKVHKDTYESLKKARVEFGKLNRQYEKEKEIVMSKEKDVDLQKSIDEAVQTALEKEKEKFNEELQKAKDEAAELRKAAEKKEKDEMVELCKGYSFVEDADSLADSLFLCKSVKGFDVILDTLEKARTAIKSALETEIGTDEEKDLTKNTEVPDHISKTSELIKARKEGK